MIYAMLVARNLLLPDSSVEFARAPGVQRETDPYWNFVRVRMWKPKEQARTALSLFSFFIFFCCLFGVSIFFNDNSGGYYNITNWTWYFGDGNVSYQQNTNHTYPISGLYNANKFPELIKNIDIFLIKYQYLIKKY